MARNESENKTLSPQGLVNDLGNHWLWTSAATPRALEALGSKERISITAAELRMLLSRERDCARHIALGQF